MDKCIAKNRALERKRRRVRKRIFGTAQRPRLAIYRSLGHIYGQLINDDEGVTLLSCCSNAKDVRPQLDGKKPTEIAKVVGGLLAERAREAGVETVVFDRGGRRYAGRIQAFADGAREKGLQF